MVEPARRSRMRRLVRLLIAFLTCIGAAAARSQPELDSLKYQDVFYASGNLRIQAYLYKPDGDGPFSAVIYNHGTRDGRERTPSPFPHVGRMLTRAGYAVLVPERRGYGKSDGEIWWKEVGSDQSRLISRQQDPRRRSARDRSLHAVSQAEPLRRRCPPRLRPSIRSGPRPSSAWPRPPATTAGCSTGYAPGWGVACSRSAPGSATCPCFSRTASAWCSPTPSRITWAACASGSPAGRT